jgi:hypothetical protein
MQLSASNEVKVALAAARRMRRPMPLLWAILAATEQAGSIDQIGASLIYGPDYATVLAALLAPPADAASGSVRRSVSPLRAVASRAPERVSRNGSESGRTLGAPPRQVGTLRAVADCRPPARSPAAPVLQRKDITTARAELRRGHFSGSHGGVAPAGTAMERSATGGAPTIAGRETPRRPAAGAVPTGIGRAPVVDPRDGGGGGRGAAASPPAAADARTGIGRASVADPGDGGGGGRGTAASPPAAADARTGVSREPAEPRAAALRAAALARDATIVEQTAAGHAALADRVASPRREPPAASAGGGRERADYPVLGAAPLAAVSASIAPPARHAPDAAGAASPRRDKPAPRAVVSPPAPRRDPAKLDDAGTALAEAAWRNGVDAA